MILLSQFSLSVCGCLESPFAWSCLGLLSPKVFLGDRPKRVPPSPKLSKKGRGGCKAFFDNFGLGGTLFGLSPRKTLGESNPKPEASARTQKAIPSTHIRRVRTGSVGSSFAMPIPAARNTSVCECGCLESPFAWSLAG
jgi:hypothetical protein